MGQSGTRMEQKWNKDVRELLLLTPTKNWHEEGETSSSYFMNFLSVPYFLVEQRDHISDKCVFPSFRSHK